MKKFIFYVSVLSLSILLFSALNMIGLVHPVSEYAKVSGKYIVDEFGRTITLKGFNLWVNDWGYGPDTQFMKFTPEHMQQIKSWGFNFVKLPFWWTSWLEPDENASGVYNEEFLSFMDWMIDMAWETGLYSIISTRVCYDPVEMPYWAGWSTHDYIVYNQVDSGGTHGLERFCNLWKMLVNRFDDKPGVIGYNPWMFPYHRQNVPDGDERVELYNNNVSLALISAIREKSNKIIFWSPVHCGAREYTDEEGYHTFGTGGYGVYSPHWNQTRVSKPLDDKNIVYMITEYGDSEVARNPEAVWDYDAQRMQESLSFGNAFQEEHNVPMMSNEGPGLSIHNRDDPDDPSNIRPIRQDRLDMLAQALNLFDDYPKNWAYWLYSGESNGYGVLENGVTSEESAIVPILKQHKATILEGDLDHNGEVNILDLTIVAQEFGSKLGDGNWNPIADRNADGIVNILDIAIVAKNWGKRI